MLDIIWKLTGETHHDKIQAELAARNLTMTAAEEAAREDTRPGFRKGEGA